MCFNYKVSLFTFCIGSIFSYILYKYGNSKYIIENEISGIFLFFISIIQLIEFLFWIDIKNRYGINKIFTIIGPLINITQPNILYLIKYLYYKPNIFTFDNLNLPIAVLNLLYFIYFLNIYFNFLSKDTLVTGVKNGHLNWGWIKYNKPYYYYLILFGINIFYLFDYKYALTLFIITYFFLYLSVKYFNYNAGELWCFFGSFIPFIMYFVSFYI